MRIGGEIMKKSYIIIGVIVVVIIAIIAILVGQYNGLVSKAELVDSKFADLDVMLQRRGDLIPNLVNTVKGYANHETEVITAVTDARAKLAGAGTVEDKAQADTELTSALNRLMVIVENYPDLKASQNFIQLSDELAGTENRIAVARKDYNDAVREYNLNVKKFPLNLVAGMFGFEQKPYFEADESSKVVPNVNFD